MVDPIQVGCPLIVPYGHVSSTWTEPKTVDPAQAEGSWKILEDSSCLEMDNLDGSVLGDAGHGEHLSAGVEADVVYPCGEVKDGLLRLGLGGGGEGVDVIDVDYA